MRGSGTGYRGSEPECLRVASVPGGMGIAPSAGLIPVWLVIIKLACVNLVRREELWRAARQR